MPELPPPRDLIRPAAAPACRKVNQVFQRTAFHLQIVTLRSSTAVAQTLRTTA